MNCKKCIHWDKCSKTNGKTRYYGETIASDNVEELCEWFISTADVVPRNEEGAECPICHGTGRIGTTDWLTKNISKKQLAEEKAKAIAEYDQQLKAEVAREIFEEIEATIRKHDERPKYQLMLDLANLKKKYTE